MTVRISSPAAIPASCAGDPGATARTRAAGIRPGYGARLDAPTSVRTRLATTLERVTSTPRRPVQTVLLAEPRGFCAGVEMAIKALAWMVRAFEPPVYCYHEIVHNRLVVERFREQGVVFVDDVADVPPGAPLMLSAHGSAPEVVDAARAEGRYVVNAVCPLVTKVHHEARVRARKGFTVLYVGHAGHDEAVGTLAVAPDAIRLVERADDLDPRSPTSATGPRSRCSPRPRSRTASGPACSTRRSTRAGDVWTASRNDLCFATTNRQGALTAIAERADAVVVIGSANSSNTLALVKVARDAGCPIVRAGRRPRRARPRRSSAAREVVGVTAGASAPEELVDAVIAMLAPAAGRRARPRHRRRRVLPAAARAPRAACPRSTRSPRSRSAVTRAPRQALGGRFAGDRAADAVGDARQPRQLVPGVPGAAHGVASGRPRSRAGRMHM